MLGSFYSISLPKLCRDWNWVDMLPFPPGNLVSTMLKIAMVDAAEGHDIFVIDFLREPPPPRKPQMVRLRGLATADGAGKFPHLF